MPDDGEIDEMSRVCAADCLESADPCHCVARFVERLVTIRGWAQPDATEVAHRALEVITHLTGDESLIERR